MTFLKGRRGMLAVAVMTIGLSGLPSSAAVSCTWTKDVTDPAISNAVLADITAFSADSAITAGAHFNATYNQYMGHIQEWDGTQWTQATLPAPTGVHEQLNSVARIPGTSEAWAVGWSRQSGDQERAVILRRTAAGWESLPVPAVNGGLTAVTARSATDAWAVGWRGSNGWILHWDGVEWKSSASPKLAVLTGVVAFGADRAWAVGWSESGSLDSTLSLRWNGTSWQRVAVPDVADHKNILRDVTRIPGTLRMWAVGYRIKPNDPHAPAPVSKSLIVRWSGTAWTIVPNLSTGFTLESVEAVSPTLAWAFGMRRLSNGSLRPLILKWNGSTWARVVEPGGYYWLEGSTTVPGSTRIWAAGSIDDEEVPVVIRGCG